MLNLPYNQGLELFTKQVTYMKKEFSHDKGETMTKINPMVLMKAIKTMATPNHYGENVTINFEFTTKEQCGEKIIEILTKKL